MRAGGLFLIKKQRVIFSWPWHTPESSPRRTSPAKLGAGRERGPGKVPIDITAAMGAAPQKYGFMSFDLEVPSI